LGHPKKLIIFVVKEKARKVMGFIPYSYKFLSYKKYILQNRTIISQVNKAIERGEEGENLPHFWECEVFGILLGGRARHLLLGGPPSSLRPPRTLGLAQWALHSNNLPLKGQCAFKHRG